MKIISLSLGDRSYDINIGKGVLSRSGRVVRSLRLGSDTIVVTNRTIYRLYGKTLENILRKDGLTVRTEIVPDSEQSKSFSVLTNLLTNIAHYDKGRQISIISFGGGVIGDLSGFAASIYKRGVPFVQIPTTLLAQVDSAIGGKVAIDLSVGKNLVGSFYQPRAVLSDTSLLKSLSIRQIRNGLAEVIKYGAISDASLFRFIELHYDRILKMDPSALEYIITRSANIKSKLVSLDEKDTSGVRAILNYGHTFGHAIEAATSYSNSYNHGEAVAIGMVVAGRIAHKLGLLTNDSRLRVEILLNMVGLPTVVKKLPLSKIYDLHHRDKKFKGKTNRLILLERIGKSRIVENVPKKVIVEAIGKTIA